jgi:hypothetical protein
MAACAVETVRRKQFEVFYFVHHLFLAVPVLVCAHVYYVLRDGPAVTVRGDKCL